MTRYWNVPRHPGGGSAGPEGMVSDAPFGQEEGHDQDQQQGLAQHPAQPRQESRRQPQQAIRIHQLQREDPLGLDASAHHQGLDLLPQRQGPVLVLGEHLDEPGAREPQDAEQCDQDAGEQQGGEDDRQALRDAPAAEGVERRHHGDGEEHGQQDAVEHLGRLPDAGRDDDEGGGSDQEAVMPFGSIRQAGGRDHRRAARTAAASSRTPARIPASEHRP